MLQIGVHHGDVRRCRRHHPFDACRRQPAPIDALEHPHPPVSSRHLPHGLGRTVGRVVIDDDDLVADAGEDEVEPSNELDHIFALVERRHDYGELEKLHRIRDLPQELAQGGRDALRHQRIATSVRVDLVAFHRRVAEDAVQDIRHEQ